VVPIAFRQPYYLPRQARFRVCPPGERRGQQLAAEEVFLRAAVRGNLSRGSVVNRQDQRFALFRAAGIRGIEQGDQRVAKLHGFPDSFAGIGAERPGSAVNIGIVGGMDAQNRAEYAVLYPAQEQLRFLHAVAVSADIMAPPAVSYVTGGGSKFRLELQGFPGDDSIPGKSDRVAVPAQSGPT